MYKITLRDHNGGNCFSGLATYYCDDIDKLETEWSKLVKDTETIERFKRSKAGEIVTDFFPTDRDEEINIVQEDKNAKVFFEKDITIKDKTIELENAYAYVAKFYVKELNIHIKYVRYVGSYLRLVTYSIRGIARYGKTEEEKYWKCGCYGNPVLKWIDKNKKVIFSNHIEDFFEDRIEAIVYYPMGKFCTLEEMEMFYKTNDISDKDLAYLLDDILGT